MEFAKNPRNAPGACLNYNLSSTVVNKKYFFQYCAGYGRYEQYMPKFVDNKKDLAQLFENIKTKEKTVVCRTKLASSGGDGIVLITPDTPADQIPTCGLYVEYIKKATEFRVHVHTSGNGDVKFLVQEKLRKKERLEEKTINYQVRNLENGWVYVVRPTDAVPDKLLTTLRHLTNDFGINFGAYDLVYNSAQDKHYILECNTAPGICNDTVGFYADNIMADYEAHAGVDITGAN
jgi:hypothetical protein